MGDRGDDGRRFDGRLPEREFHPGGAPRQDPGLATDLAVAEVPGRDLLEADGDTLDEERTVPASDIPQGSRQDPHLTSHQGLPGRGVENSALDAAEGLSQGGRMKRDGQDEGR
ncbi:MAG TPA: hypothetical protein VJ982_10040 [Gemmatimonadota bacterium]|nr:hypothetical protein [Gemmatimonadota bacterium]